MSWLRFIVAGFALTFAFPVSAQTTTINDRLPVPKEAIEIGGFSFFEGSVVRGEQSIRIVDIMSYPDRTAPLADGRINRVYVARTYSPGQNSDANFLVKWADARTCPKIYGVLEGFNALEAPRFNVPNLFGLPPLGAGVRPPSPIPTEAQVYSVWGRATQADNAMAYMEIEAHNGLIAEWVASSKAQLSDCWTERPPVFAD